MDRALVSPRWAVRRLLLLMAGVLAAAVPARAQALPREFIYFGNELLVYQASFVDVPPGDPFYASVNLIANLKITGGCGTPSTYCPNASITRETMPVFLLAAKFGSSYSPPACSPPNIFSDVSDTSPFCRWIEDLANRGVVAGCGGGLYCPTNPVTRDQMAVFLLATLDPTINPPACTTPTMFADVPASNPFCRWIQELVRRGITAGCGGNNYCPTQAVTRAQMAALLVKTFNLAL